MKNNSVKKHNFRSRYVISSTNTEDSFRDLHDDYELAFFINANLSIFIKNSKYEIKDGDLFLIKPDVIHHLFYNNTDKYERYVIHFKKNFIESLLIELNMDKMLMDFENMAFGKVSIRINQRNEFESLFKFLMNEPSGFTDQKLKLHLIILLIKYYEELEKNQKTANPVKKQLSVIQIIKYIDDNYADNIDLDQLERKFYLSRYYICHIFKDITGFPVNQYIQYRRVIEAQRLLTQTNKDILEISFECGFNSLQNFYKAFKKFTGISPNKFRK